MYGKDSIIFEKDKETIVVKSKYKEITKSPLQINLKFPKLKKNKLRLKLIDKWLLKIQTENETFNCDLKNRKVSKNNFFKNKKTLTLVTNEKILRCIIEGKIHLDNATIGNYLTWRRVPNEYNKTLHDLMFFFSLPFSKPKK